MDRDGFYSIFQLSVMFQFEIEKLLCLGLFANQYLLRGMHSFAFWQWLFGSLTLWTPCHHHCHFHLADFKHFISQLLHRVLLSTLRGEERQWLIALIIRDIIHFRSCIKESIIPSLLSPHFPAFPSFSPSPASHKTYNMMILRPRGPAGCQYLLGCLSELGPLDFLTLYFMPFGRSSRVTHVDDRYLHVHISSPPLIFDTCIHDPNNFGRW